MIAAIGSITLVMLWLYYWLFVASLDSGRTSTITIIEGKPPIVEEHYDTSNRFKPYIPLFALGVYGSMVGAITSLMVHRKPDDRNLIRAVCIAPTLAAVSSVVVLGMWAFLTPSTFHRPGLGAFQRVIPTLAIMLVYSPGVGIFSGLPAVLTSIGTVLLILEARAYRGGADGIVPVRKQSPK